MLPEVGGGGLCLLMLARSCAQLIVYICVGIVCACVQWFLRVCMHHCLCVNVCVHNFVLSVGKFFCADVYTCINKGHMFVPLFVLIGMCTLLFVRTENFVHLFGTFVNTFVCAYMCAG